MISPRNSADDRCVIVGAGGHARVVLECLRASGRAFPYVFLDSDPTLWGKEVFGVSVLGGDDRLPEIVKSGVTYFVVGVGASGQNAKRQRLFELARTHGLKALTIVHPSSLCSDSATIGEGCQLLPGSIINAGTRLDENVIINSGAIVEHDCVLEDHVHVAPGARLASAVRVGRGAHIGIGATVRECLTIGRGALVGAGAVVVRNVPPYTVVVGVPARPLKEISP